MGCNPVCMVTDHIHRLMTNKLSFKLFTWERLRVQKDSVMQKITLKNKRVLNIPLKSHTVPLDTTLIFPTFETFLALLEANIIIPKPSQLNPKVLFYSFAQSNYIFLEKKLQ